ncbi:type II toxin-antitoxin system ParD family antitoxin [Mesorhizobium sp. B2-6-2]|uniref:type II toxin-antitoxin system ParD family antitoxin n=1 Tax=Mesorhizobium sp. B2-6-2 TaxID=2589915 RepID=UPI00112BCB76|nr:type II toxin-antitoxin system ParD family antitoxin [Mesorhizobium sp. B2-6-2]TPJ80229.1 type II toxin-antitoxin system ParD family antitoxin [Mesorhizobium sp. B2-6-2]
MESAEKLSVTVTPAMARLIREKVEDGSYGSASEVIRAALRAFQREEEEHAGRMASIRARVKASLEDKRPNVSREDVRAHLHGLFAEYSSPDDDSAA